MKKVLISLLVSLLLLPVILIPTVQADSPVTSTPFSNAYLDIEMVQRARFLGGVIDEETCRFLASLENPLEIKAAVINAIYHDDSTWDLKENAESYVQYIYEATLENLEMNKLAPQDLLVLGYLVLLDNYLQPEKALPYLELAGEAAPRSFTIALVKALAEAQSSMLQSDWSAVWLPTKKALSSSALQEDRLRDDALFIVLDYLYLYRSPHDDIIVLFNEHFLLGEPEPVLLKGRTLVSWSDLFQVLGVEAAWDKENGQILAIKESTTLMLAVNQRRAVLNGQSREIDQPPLLLDGQLMVPLRFVSEAFGAAVRWDGKDQSVRITMN